MSGGCSPRINEEGSREKKRSYGKRKGGHTILNTETGKGNKESKVIKEVLAEVKIQTKMMEKLEEKLKNLERDDMSTN